jgi:ubiquinone/menaquinone biosynthesis C-methylase UbiE
MMETAYTPPLGFAALTPLYDRAVKMMTREAAWRTRLVERIDAIKGETILDVGSGTGSLAIAVTAAAPGCIFKGIDPDPAAVELARSKAALASSSATFEQGRFSGSTTQDDGAVDKISCSLVLHQVSLAEKRRLLRAMFDRLRPGGQLFIADYGLQPTFIMRLAFRLTVQMLDGRSDTQPNADGILPALIEEAGFEGIRILDRFDTVTGRIEIIRAERPRMAHLKERKR